MSIDLTKRKEQAEVSLVKHLQAARPPYGVW